MAESTTFPKPREANDAGYRRISGFAIAGLVVGIFFVLFLLVQAIMGMMAHTTILLPLWFEFIAVLGVALSLIGARSIRRADGTLAGTRIAQFGLWISLVTGLGYGAYYGATYLAVRQQADAFTEEWFDKIRKGKVNEAFLLTQPPGVRRAANPDDEKGLQIRFNASIAGPKGAPSKGGMLDIFRGNELIVKLRQGGDATKITPLGVRTWEHIEGAYVVKRVYLVEVPEGSFELRVTAVGQEGPESADKGRGWLVNFMDTSVEKDTLKKTKIGERMDQMRQTANVFVTEWTHLLMAGLLESSYARMLEPKEETALLARLGMRMYYEHLCAFAGTERGNIVNSMTACAPSDRFALRQFGLPGFDAAYTKTGLLDFTQMTGDDRAARDAVEVSLRDMLTTKRSNFVVGGLVPGMSSSKRFWSVDNEQRVLLPIDCQIQVGPPGAPARYYADTIVWLRSEPGDLDNDKAPRWQLTKVEVLRAGDLASLQSPRGLSSRFQ